MNSFAGKIFRGDRVMWVIFAILCVISIVEVYSASSMLTFKTNYWQPILKHTMFLLTGTAIVLLVHSVNPKYFRIFAVMLPFVWLLLIATQFMGHTVNGANRYLFGFQPSEIAKLSLISCVAFILSRQKNKLSESLSFKWIWILTIVTCILILRDNFSTAAILYGVVAIMMFIGQISFKRMTLFVSVTVASLALLFAFIWFFPGTAKNIGLERGVTWVGRITDYKEKPDIRKGDYEVTDDNFQTTQANIAVARGGIFGTMPGNGRQRDFLPQAYSDFIYAIIIEETGIAGGIAVLSLYVFLFIRAGIIAGRCTKLFPKYLVIGSALMLVIQAVVNMSVSVGLIPVTGQPLPLISKGGSSILVTCVFVGIILSVSRFENPRGVRQEEIIAKEFEEEKQLTIENEELITQTI
ncbi:MAG: FtsW/RodA/SpoVE family cell cycle protein [Candidatus Azobacteroides sp.]|nr:FtsW/RodA/SpoVE family cell cycle protein [Candidatus Azobacteroides sp.]